MNTDSPEDALARRYQQRAWLEREIERLEAEVARRFAQRRVAELEAHRATKAADAAAHERRITQAAEDEARLIVLHTSTAMGVDIDFMVNRTRTPNLVEARAVAYFVARSRGWSYSRIGKWAGRDHTTVMNGVRRVHNNQRLIDRAANVLARLKVENAA